MKIKKLNEAFNVDTVQKRIARHNEFDNGHVLHNYEKMTSAEAEEKARLASIENPNDIYYVSYDDIMNPSSDIKWKNGKQVTEQLENETFNNNLREKLNEASYGGAFDIADDQYFTKDDLLDFAEEVLGNVTETFEGTFDIGGVWFEDGCVITQIVDDEGNMFEDTTRVDMRKIKKPEHLIKAYSQQVSSNIIKQIKELKGIDESVVSSSHEFDDDADDLSYYYDDESWEEPGVNPRKDFDADGREYTWVKRHGDVLHLDFDNWAVWEAYCHDDAESYYFIVDEDTGFIDWGPCETQQEAQDFLDSKKFDWDSEYEDESLTEDATDIETETLEGPKQGPEFGLAALLNDAIKDEWDAIDTYNSLAVSARDEGFENIAEVIDEINTEENKHVGQLQEILKTISPNTDAIKVGEQEGKEQMSEASDNDTDFELSSEFGISDDDDISEAEMQEALNQIKKLKECTNNSTNIQNIQYNMQISV